MQTDPRLGSLLLRWQQFRRQGLTPTAAELCSDCPDLTDALAQRIDALNSIAELLSSSASPDTTAPHAPPLFTDQALLEQAGRFRILGEIAHGGMGAVLRAHDPAIGRDVAVKVVLARHRNDSGTLRRFLSEARLAGQLQHPGVAPVYDVGELPDGSPYFAMKLIQGRTLAALLAERPEPGHDLPRFLRYFEVVCQAVGYAHSQGIIHRDLKPQNVMVGAFGEVQVMDWGLAKRLDSPQPRTDSPISYSYPLPRRERRESEGGSLPPSHPCETGPGGEGETPRCEGATPADGGPLTDGNMVIGTLTYLPPEQARRENDRVGPGSDVFGLGGILCEILTGSPPFRGEAMIDLLVQSAAGDLSDAFARLDGCGADGELVRLAKSCLAAEPADRPADGGAAATRMGAYLEGVQQRLRASELERAAAQARAEEAAKKAAQEQRARLVQLGLSAAVLLVLLAGISGTSLGLLHAKKAWSAESEQRQIAQDKQREAESSAEKAAAEQRRAQKAEKETLEDYRASTDDAIEQLIGSKRVLGPQEKTYLEKTLRRWQAFAQRTGDDERSRAIRAEGQFRVALLRANLGQNENAIAGYRMTLAIQQRLADDFPTVPEYRKLLAATYNNLGYLLADLNEAEKAAEQYRKALAIQQKLADDFSAVPEYHSALAMTHNNLGALLGTQNQGNEAAEQYLKALAIRQNLADKFPASHEYRNYLARSHNNLGVLLKNQRQRGKAAEQFYRALPILQTLVNELPAVPEYRVSLAATHTNLGTLLASLKQGKQAAEQYQKALDIQQKLADDFPAVPAYRNDLALTHNNLGFLLAGQNQRTASAQQYQNALAVLQKLVDEFPRVSDYQVALGTSCCNYGKLLQRGAMVADSVPWFNKAIRTLAKVHHQDPRAATPRLFLRNSYQGRAHAFDALQKYDEAVKDWNLAIELSQSQEQPWFRAQRASSRVNAGQVSEAVVEVAAMTSAGKWPAEAWYNFACIYALASGKSTDKKQEYADRAIELLRKAFQAGYKDAAHIAKDKDLDPLRQRDDFKIVLESLSKLKEKKPAGPKR